MNKPEIIDGEQSDDTEAFRREREWAWARAVSITALHTMMRLTSDRYSSEATPEERQLDAVMAVLKGMHYWDDGEYRDLERFATRNGISNLLRVLAVALEVKL